MRIEKTNNSPNFKMAWHKEAKRALSVAVAKLPQRQQSEVIDIINNLEHNSPHHTLKYYKSGRDMVFSADQKTLSGSHYFDFPVKRFISGLKKLQQFILKQNVAVPQVSRVTEKVEVSLKRYVNDRIFDPGLKIPEVDVSHFAVNLAKHLQTKKKVDKVSEVVNLFEVIDKKAKSIGATVRLTAFNGYNIVRGVSDLESYSSRTDNLRTLKKVEKRLDKLAKTIAKKQAIEDKSFLKDERSIRNFERRQKIVASVKNSKPFVFLNGIKTKVISFFESIKENNAKKLEAAQAKIAEKLDI